MQREWPNLFVVGAAKAGTTSLWRYLGQHPEIFMSPVKEPDYFTTRSVPTEAETVAYLDLFAEAGDARLRGEASPGYLADRTAPRAIKRATTKARIVISLREPIERTHSAYLSLVNDGVELRSFAEAVRDDIAGQRVEGTPRYVKPTLYATGVKRYLDRFGERRVHVMFFEDLAADAAGCMREVYEFLGVDPAFAEQLRAKPQNQFRRPRNTTTAWLLRARRLGRHVVPRRLHSPVADALTQPARKPGLEPEAVAMLHDVYEPEVTALRALLDRPLPEAWRRRFPAPDTPSVAASTG